MSKKITIQNTYYDALNFATASINEKKDFHLPLSELRLLQKLIHYSSKQANITWSSEQIGNHLFITPNAVDPPTDVGSTVIVTVPENVESHTPDLIIAL